MMETRAFEPGDKVWTADGIYVFHAILTGHILTGPSVGPWAILRRENARRTHPLANLTLLPPWIDEPHPLDLSQRVFAELHEDAL